MATRGSLPTSWAASCSGSKRLPSVIHRGGIYNPQGLDYEAVTAWKRKTGSVVGFQGADNVANAELLELPVVVLFPAALESVIREDNAPRVKAKVVAELANGPTTPEADLILHENGVYVIPNFLCNAAA